MCYIVKILTLLQILIGSVLAQGSLTHEINRLPIESIVSGPLNAAVEAQAFATFESIVVIRNAGFTNPGLSTVANDDWGEVSFVELEYNVTRETGQRVSKAKLPLLTLFPIPYLTVEEVSVDFNLKISSVDRTLSKGLKRTNAGEYCMDCAYQFAGSVQTRSQTQSHGIVQEEYDMSVKVKAKVSDVPQGMEAVLSVLLDTVKSDKQST